MRQQRWKFLSLSSMMMVIGYTICVVATATFLSLILIICVEGEVINGDFEAVMWCIVK